MRLNLDGRGVLVTGAGSGIGQALARAFAREGARVAVNDLAAEGIEETLALIRREGGAGCAAACDVARLDDVKASLERVARDHGPIDILVNNAAVLIANLPFVESRPEDCDREIKVILYGTMNCTRALLPGMIERGYGKIVNIVSDAARVGQEREASYSSAKGGVISFTKSIAREVGRYNVNVNAVSPAATNTPLRQGMLQKLAARIGDQGVAEREEKIRRAYPLRRLGEPEDVANAVLFLASDAAKHVTGQILAVNGGYAMTG